MRSNIDNSLLRKVRMVSPTHAIMRFALTGTFVIPVDGPSLYFLDPGASDRTVYLPIISEFAGQEVTIFNISTTNVLNVVDSNGVAVVSVPKSVGVIVSSYASGWRFILGFDTVLSNMILWTSQTVTTATATLAAVATEAFVNRAGVVTVTLPDAEAWYLLHTLPTSHLLIKDVSGAASTNNVTISRAGADTIEGATSLSITSDYGGWKLRRVSAGVWGIVG